MNTTKFSDIFEFQVKSKIKAGDGLEVGDYPFYTSSETISKYLDDYQFESESLVFGTGGNASIHLTKSPFSTSTDCLVAQLKDVVKNQFLIDYIFYFLSGNIRILEKGFKGAGLKHISKSYIGDIDIPILPLEVQQEIVKILDQADALRQKRKQAIDLLDEYLKSVFLEMFGDPLLNTKEWESKYFKDISVIKIGPFGSLLHTYDYIQGGVPLINPTHIVDKKIVVDEKLTVSESKYNELKPYHLKTGDVVLGRRGEIGRCGLVTKNEDGYLCGTGSMYIRPNNEINSIFLTYYISSQSFKRRLEAKAIGITMKNLNAGTVQNMPIIVPPINLQNKFSEIVTDCEALKRKMFGQSIELDNQFNVLIQKSFSVN